LVKTILKLCVTLSGRKETVGIGMLICMGAAEGKIICYVVLWTIISILK